VGQAQIKLLATAADLKGRPMIPVSSAARFPQTDLETVIPP
jgi:hypothetical protein